MVSTISLRYFHQPILMRHYFARQAPSIQQVVSAKKMQFSSKDLTQQVSNCNR